MDSKKRGLYSQLLHIVGFIVFMLQQDIVALLWILLT